MNKKLVYILLFAFALVNTGSLFAAGDGISVGTGTTESYAKVGMSGGQFLKVGHGARASAMAGSISAITNDLSSVFWNPAGIAELPSVSVEFDYTSWLAGINHNFAAVGIPVGDGFGFAVHFTGFSSQEMERTTIERPDGLNSFFTASDIAVGATFAGYLTDQFSFGITGRYLDNTIGEANASGFSFDVGTKYKTGIKGIVLGVSLHGLTTQLTYTGNEFLNTLKLVQGSYSSPLDAMLVSSPFDIPLVFRANVAADLYKDEDNRLTGALDFTTTSDSPEQFAAGFEYEWNNLLAFRAGYRLGHDLQGFSGGIGFNYQTGAFSGKIDYSISPMYYDMGIVNRISIAIDLGK